MKKFKIFLQGKRYLLKHSRFGSVLDETPFLHIIDDNQ
jgi:hypothetical protein